jgi:hypothetical protein
MRLLIVLLAGVAGLAAQVTEPDAADKLKQFERNLQNAMRPSGAPVLVKLPVATTRVCAIPLLKVGPDAAFKSNMPVITPDPKMTFSAREVMPPGPTCGEPEKK